MRSRKPVDTSPARMGPLAKLPIFLDLQGRRAVLAGGSAAACWKAELLEAAGATVHVYAQEISPEMTERLSPRLIHHARSWATDIFEGAAVALADIDDEEEARAFYCAGRTAGVPVNVIDKPSYCQFQFGSIVNRSPVIIGISTDGAAPILGQAIRRRIETVLPPALADWGQLARDIRDRVMTSLAKGAPRRAFWEAFADRSFGPAPTLNTRADIDALLAAIGKGPAQSSGRVTLVGAGPGDAELLTLKAVRALQSADIILFDDLVSDEVLELARREAKRMMVGKRGQRESCAQSDINALMVQLAQQGKHVVRLKSGDPMIFGRAGEEIAELEAHGIAVDVVPGITTALAVAASLGTSLTHRDHAQSVRFVTGHTRDGKLSDDLDWEGLADPATSLVFYMGGRTSMAIATRLIAAGLPPTTPVVMIAAASRPEESRWHGDLEQLSISANDLITADHPVIICIGRTFAAKRANAAVQTPHNTGRDQVRFTHSLGAA
jgi:uroporphyrin-III C-methyltransferase / precorrin-2 dehydrogenase / sirohydrochlorin ferrochelatase